MHFPPAGALIERMLGVPLVKASGVRGLKFQGAQQLFADIVTLEIIDKHDEQTGIDFCQFRMHLLDPRVPLPENAKELQKIAAKAGRDLPS